MHEIITLQLGRQSNYVATHFWNAQESYFTYGQDEPSPIDHDIHWRAGLGADGSETYLPRTLIYDRKGGFGSLRKVNALYAAQEDQATDPTSLPGAGSLWSGAPVVHRAPPIEPSAYTRSLDAGTQPAPLTPSAVRYWSDFSRVYYHPRSLVSVGDEPEVTTAGAGTGAATATPASQQSDIAWAAGESLFTTLDREHDLLDRDMRHFVEEADHMQGLQVLATVDDAWGGFAARYLERLHDEYGKTTIWLWALQEPAVAALPREKRLVRLANKARTLAAACNYASLVVPLAMPSIPRHSVDGALDWRSSWYTSALLATAVETATLPSRLRRHGSGGGDSMAYLTELLNATGKQTMANLQMTAARPWKQVLQDSRAKEDGTDDDNGPTELHLDVDFAPQDEPRTGVYGKKARTGKKTRMFGQAVVSRRNEAGKEEEEREEEMIHEGTYNDRDPDRQDMAYRRFALKPVSQRYCVDLGFPMLDSFPHIYPNAANQSSIAVATGLATDSVVADRIQALRSTVAAPWAVSLEDREDLSNDLAGLADAYHDGWSSGSDEGDDE